MAGEYSYINNHYRKVFEGIHGKIVGEPYQLTMHPEDSKVCEEVAAKCFAQPDHVFPATIRKHDGAGGFFITQWDYKAILDDHNQPAGIFCLGHDITKFKLQSEELTETQSQLDHKNQMLREIAFNQSHIIRRPLANILGLAMILDTMDLDQNLRNICSMLTESSKQLDEVIRTIVKKTVV